MQQEQVFKPKHFRLLRPDLFNLDKNKVYLATETPAGYVLKIDDFYWIGFPKKTVEKSFRMFRLYNGEEHRIYNRFKKNKRPRIPLTLKLRSNVSCS